MIYYRGTIRTFVQLNFENDLLRWRHSRFFCLSFSVNYTFLHFDSVGLKSLYFINTNVKFSSLTLMKPKLSFSNHFLSIGRFYAENHWSGIVTQKMKLWPSLHGQHHIWLTFVTQLLHFHSSSLLMKTEKPQCMPT